MFGIVAGPSGYEARTGGKSLRSRIGVPVALPGVTRP
jgi:hypothetical protein